ncbi:MAG: Holliday junction resolvase RuvX [Acidobacteriota bacterium]
MVILALDYGEKRIGAAVGNSELKTSTPVRPLKNSGKELLIPELKKLIDVYEISLVVIGYPLHMDGSESLMSKKVKKFRNLVSKETGLDIKLIDERLTSFEAEEMLKNSRGDIRKSKDLIDSVSAHIILTEYLETI